MPEVAVLSGFSNNLISSFLYIIHNLNRNVAKIKKMFSVTVFLKPGKIFLLLLIVAKLEILTVIETCWTV